MFRGYGLRLLTVGGGLAAILIIAYACEPKTPSVSNDGAQVDQNNGRYEGEVTCNADCQVSFGLGVQASGTNEGDKSQGSEDRAKNAPQNVDEADLLAQERMAYWTRVIGILTAAGLAILYFTLLEAFETSKHAEKMLAQQRKTDEQTLRAYVCPAGGNILDLAPDKITRAIVDLKNCGQTPAYDVRVVIVARASDDFPNPQHIKLGKPKNTGHSGVLAPDARFFATYEWKRKLTQAEIARIKSGANSIYVAGAYSYRDAFKKLRRGTFKCTLNFTSIENGKGKLSPCEKGNRAN